MEQTERGRTAWAISLAACLILTSWAAPVAASQSWTTEPDFEIGAGVGPGGNGGFSRVGSVRVSRDARVHVVEPLASRVTVWSPSGELILRLEREGPLADFGRPHGVRLLPDGFWATYDRHFVRFSDDGAVLEVVESSVPGAGVVFDNHGILTRGRLPPPAVILGWVQGETGHELAVLHYAGNGGYRTADTIALMDVGRMALGIRFDDGTDTLRVWYALHRRDDVAEPRRVLLPEWFQLLDATRTHVWGLRSESENRSRVVGRRLVPRPNP